MLKQYFMLIVVCLILNGCAGTGFHKKAEFIPDEFSMSIDSNPQNRWNIDEVTGGFKWKVK